MQQSKILDVLGEPEETVQRLRVSGSSDDLGEWNVEVRRTNMVIRAGRKGSVVLLQGTKEMARFAMEILIPSNICKAFRVAGKTSPPSGLVPNPPRKAGPSPGRWEEVRSPWYTMKVEERRGTEDPVDLRVSWIDGTDTARTATLELKGETLYFRAPCGERRELAASGSWELLAAVLACCLWRMSDEEATEVLEDFVGCYQQDGELSKLRSHMEKQEAASDE